MDVDKKNNSEIINILKDKSDDIVFLGDEITNIAPIKEEKITPIHQLTFAKYILLGIAILFVLGMLSAVFTKESYIFDACKTILPPIATLIIGFYFRHSS